MSMREFVARLAVDGRPFELAPHQRRILAALERGEPLELRPLHRPALPAALRREDTPHAHRQP